MYWPVGAPHAYALSKHESQRQSHLSHDGLDEDVSAARAAGEDGDAHGNGKVEPEEDANVNAGIVGEGNGTTVESFGNSAGSATANDEILAAKMSRSGGIFASMTRSSLTIWQSKPMVALAAVVRSDQSMKAYGHNTALLMRPDAMIIVLETALGFLITYAVAMDSNAHVYEIRLPEATRHTRRESSDGYMNYRRPSGSAVHEPGSAASISEVSLRFRMVIRIDAGISEALALDDELIVATRQPAAMQCIRWAAEKGRPQTSTELLTRLPWMGDECNIIEMVHDRPMNLSCWLTDDGKAYVVQRRLSNNANIESPAGMFKGFCFRQPGEGDALAVKAAINARFSLIAVGCETGDIEVHVVKDYTGNIPWVHKVKAPASITTCGRLTFLGYSPDGYALMAGYEKGWSLWSVYGNSLASSFHSDHTLSQANGEDWLRGVRDAFWIGGGCELALVGRGDDRLWVIDMARNAATGCLSPANVSRGLLYTSDAIKLYKGHEISDLTALPSDVPLWQTVQVPKSYMVNHWPIRVAVVSPDGKYVAIAGRRGLAHYSVVSGRWRTFEDPQAENECAVRGGMCWHQHLLIACVETGDRHQVRVYSREKALERIMHSQDLPAAAILTATSGVDSLLVYAYDNTLLHYIIAVSGSSVKLVQVGQIGFHGIIRAPPRVRAVSWILPEDQLEHGDPSQDVATASVLFLVDAKLVLLQPSRTEGGELKYDMRVIAPNVEYYILMRDQSAPSVSSANPASSDISRSTAMVHDHLGRSLRDSLCFFDGDSLQVWSDVQDVLACAPSELERDLPPTVRVPLDFYPISALIEKGVVHGLDADLAQRKDVNYSFFRQTTRTQLFLPQLLRYHLAEYNSPAALHLANSYQSLPYFAHALEVLLHDVLDHEVDNPPDPPETALLPTTLSFLSSFPSYLDVVVNCTRKTELRSWQTLFSYLPPVRDLFEQALAQGKLKTAAGYLLVLHTFEQGDFKVHEFSRMLRQAAVEQDWDLCAELARFLVGIDSTGRTLDAALVESGLRGAANGDGPLVESGSSANGVHMGGLVTQNASSLQAEDERRQQYAADYFSWR